VPRTAALAYRSDLRRQTREAVVECIGLRPRNTPRPTMRLYRAACGMRDPLAVIERYVEDLMAMRDSVPARSAVDLRRGDSSLSTALSRFVIDARAASEARILGAHS
jgi:hypothetical protein